MRIATELKSLDRKAARRLLGAFSFEPQDISPGVLWRSGLQSVRKVNPLRVDLEVGCQEKTVRLFENSLPLIKSDECLLSLVLEGLQIILEELLGFQ